MVASCSIGCPPRRTRALTIIEVLVAGGISCLLLGVLFMFHVFAQHMVNRQQRISDNYRRMVEVLDKVETLLANAEVLQSDATDVMFALPSSEQPLSHRFPLVSPELSTLSVIDDEVILRQGNQQQTLLKMEPWEQLSFALYQDNDPNQTKRYVDVIASGNPPVRSAAEGTEQPFGLVRRIYVEPRF